MTIHRDVSYLFLRGNKGEKVQDTSYLTNCQLLCKGKKSPLIYGVIKDQKDRHPSLEYSGESNVFVFMLFLVVLTCLADHVADWQPRMY